MGTVGATRLPVTDSINWRISATYWMLMEVITAMPVRSISSTSCQRVGFRKPSGLS